MKRIVTAAVIMTAVLFWPPRPAHAQNYGTVTCSSSTATSIHVTTTNRRGLTVYNNGSQTAYLGFDVNVSTSTGLPLPMAVGYEFNNDYAIYRGDLFCKAAAGSTGVELRWWEWTR